MPEVPHETQVYTNREYSWLQFNERVLEEAEDPTVPLLERLKFLSIFQSNLDEFFMVRVGSLIDRILLKKKSPDSKTGLSPKKQLALVTETVQTLLPRRDRCYASLTHLLSQEGLQQMSMEELSDKEHAWVKNFFRREIAPFVAPQIIDKRQPFPFLHNKHIYIGLLLSTRTSGAVRLALIPTSGPFSRLILLPEQDNTVRFLLAEEVIAAFAEEIFCQHHIMEKTVFRITRNADIELDHTLEDFEQDDRAAMETLLKKRKKLAPVRLETFGEPSAKMILSLCSQLKLGQDALYVNQTPLDLSFVFSFCGEKRWQHLLLAPQPPQPSAACQTGVSMLTQVEQKDILLHYPYHSMKPFLQLLQEASQDPQTLSIQITLYRIARDSKIAHSLMTAAENGKQVTVLLELRARFDEAHNILWSKRLQEAGCRVMYGLPEQKVHSKVLLITRRVQGKIQYITQVGTGNYNESTAKLYTDYALMTAHPGIGQDAHNFFHYLSLGLCPEQADHLLFSPLLFKPKMLELIEEQITLAGQGKPAAITLKMNSLSDKQLMQALMRASCAGVKIRLLVRGICCFKPGIPNLTEQIEIYSIVGRYLEHSRVFIFGQGEQSKVYIGSADFMSRNTERRVEAAIPVLDPALRTQILQDMEVLFADRQKLRKQYADGKYRYVRPLPDTLPTEGQQVLWQQAKAAAAVTPTPPPSQKPVSRWKKWFTSRRKTTKED